MSWSDEVTKCSCGYKLYIETMAEVFERDKERGKMFSGISSRQQISEVLKKYGKNPEEIKEIFGKLMACGTIEYITQSVIEDPKLLTEYLQMKSNGIPDQEIAFKLIESWRREPNTQS